MRAAVCSLLTGGAILQCFSDGGFVAANARNERISPATGCHDRKDIPGERARTFDPFGDSDICEKVIFDCVRRSIDALLVQ